MLKNVKYSFIFTNCLSGRQLSQLHKSQCFVSLLSLMTADDLFVGLFFPVKRVMYSISFTLFISFDIFTRVVNLHFYDPLHVSLI